MLEQMAKGGGPIPSTREEIKDWFGGQVGCPPLCPQFYLSIPHQIDFFWLLRLQNEKIYDRISWICF
jgi:hypothetical protein